jgi:hypothetical protein
MASAAGTRVWRVSCVMMDEMSSLHCQGLGFPGREPAYAYDLVKLLLIVHHHWLVVVFGNNLPISETQRAVGADGSPDQSRR